MADDSTTSTNVPDVGDASPAPDADRLRELVDANRILFRHGVVDAFGHISVRHDRNADRFLLARNMAPGLVGADDIIEFDMDSNPVNARGRRVYLERFIHGEIYRTRPDVQAVVHSHAPAVVPFGVVSGAALKPIWHMSFFLTARTPVFEIRDAVGDGSDMLIRSRELGAALAKTIGDNNVALMRGHGATVTGTSIREAVFYAVFTQMNAELQLKSAALGEPTFLSNAETAAAKKSVGSQIDRAWDLWVAEVSTGVAN